MFQCLLPLRLVFDFFSLFGLDLFSPDRSPSAQRKWRVWGFLVLLLQGSVLVATFVHRNSVLRSDLSPVGMLLNLIHYACTMTTACVCIASALVQEQRQRLFWLRLEHLRRLRFQELPSDTAFFRRVARRCVLLLLLLLLGICSVFLFITYDSQWTLFACFGLPSVLVNRLSCVRVLVPLEALRCELEALERSLRLFVRESSARAVHVSLVLHWYVSIADSARELLGVLEWSLLALFLDGWINLGVVFYWSYVQTFCERSLGAGLVLLLSAAVLVLALFLVILGCHSLRSLGRRSARLAGQLQVDGAWEEVELLLLQMEGDPIEFSVLGLFTLDMRLFAQILASIPAYMVIYTQFLECN